MARSLVGPQVTTKIILQFALDWFLTEVGPMCLVSILNTPNHTNFSKKTMFY